MNTSIKHLFLAAVLSSTFVVHAEESQPVSIAITASQQQALGIKTSPVKAINTAWESPYPAEVVVPNAQLRVVSAPLSGLLESLLVAEGELVKKGQLLAMIHSPQLLEQQSAYLDARTNLDLARTENQRNEQLFKEGIIAQRRHLESSAKYSQLKTRVEQLRQNLKLSGMSNDALARLQRHRKLSPSLKILAPLSGVVLEQLVTPGKQLNALDPVYKVGHLKPLWLEVHVPLEQLGDLKKGTVTRVVKPSITGKVITVGRMVHGADQSVLVRAEINEGADQLRPGQFVQAQIAHTGSGESDQLQIPRSALVRNEGKQWVFVARPGGFLPVSVEILKEEASNLMIRGQLTTEDQVVVAGTVALKAAWLESAE